ncbi:MAG: SRPBCC domain-containing protein [Actinobacteria bacterium]|nr:SRPBCC domain-containing protein [Actinomycetota bacterium]
MTTPDVPYRFELELTVPGTAEQVWHAIASAEGISAWLMPTGLEPRQGGAIAFDMGPDMTSRGRVNAFEPTRRFAYEEDWAALVGRSAAEVTPLVTEFLVEAESGGTCAVRVVTSAFGTGADWENEFWEEMSNGWAPMLDNLRLYLTHFPGQRATNLCAGATSTGTPEALIDAVRDALGIAGAGEVVDANGIVGRVERSLPRHFLLCLDEPAPGFLSFYAFTSEGSAGVHVQGYLFSDAAPSVVEREQPRLQAWLDGVAADAATADASSA